MSPTEQLVTFRPYLPSDQPGIEWLYSRTPPWGRTYPRPQPIPDDIRGIGSEYEHVVVAVEQDRDGEAVVGLTAVRTASRNGDLGVPEFINVNDAARLHHVMVAPERWRMGIGRQLTEAAISWACHHGYTSLVLDTTAEQQGAIALYLALGFTEAARTRFREWDIVWFRLELLATQPQS